MKLQDSKIEQLESLRGIAAFIVFLGHFTLAFVPQRHGYILGAIPGGNLMETPFFFILNGSASVTLFFVLSGFVLSYGYFERNQKPIVGAIIRRWPRLFPIALISTVISFMLYKSGLYYYAAASEITHSDWMSKFGYSTRGFANNTSFFESISQGAFFIFFRGNLDSWMNSSLWTMHLELLGSFIVFGIVAAVRDARESEACVVFITTGVLAFFGNVYLPLFVAGTALAFFHSRKQFKIKQFHKIRTFINAMVILFFFRLFGSRQGSI